MELEAQLNDDERDLNQAVKYALDQGKKSSESYLRIELIFSCENLPSASDMNEDDCNTIAILYLNDNVMKVL